MKPKKLLAALLATAQLICVAPAALADETDEQQPFSLTYSAEKLGTEYGYGQNIGTEMNSRGFSFDATNTIWSVQALNDTSTVNEPEIRFGTRTFSSMKSDVNVMSLDFSKDTVNKPGTLNGNGYIFESELSIVNRDAGALCLTLNGKDSDSNTVKLAQIRFQTTEGTSNKYPGKAFASKATGAQVGNSVGAKMFSTVSKNDSNPGELLYVKVMVDFVNKKYSAWVVPRKTEATGTYTATEPSEDYLLVENADLLSKSAVEFSGLSADFTQTRYGNAIKYKTISVTGYTPEKIEPEETPAPTTPSDGVTLRMGVTSDLQYGRASQDSSLSSLAYAGKKFKNAVNQIIEKAGGLDKLDVLLINGDITHNSTASEWQAFVADLEEVIPSGSHTKVLMLRGNHDAKPNLQSNFTKYLADYDSMYANANNIVEVNGYRFVLVGQDTQRSNDEASSYEYIHSPETISWFETAMAEAAQESEGKPIFVGMHPAAYGTVFGGQPVTGTRSGAAATSSYWGTSELLPTLNKYSNAITFSGHSHWDMANEMSIYQENFTALNTGAVNNMEIPDCYDESFQPKRFGSNENESTGFYIEVNTDNEVTVHRVDFNRECEIRTPWVINAADKDSWTYTKDRDTTAPYFDEDAEVTVENITQTGAKINFTQAKDADSNAVRYQMDLVNNDTGATDATYSISSYYWQGADMPAVNYWNASNLEAETEYTVKITAYDDFDNASGALTGTFKTADRTVPTPIVDIAFTGNGPVDNSAYAAENGIAPETSGEIPYTYNSELKRYEATTTRDGSTVNAKDSTTFIRTLFPEGRQSAMKNGYTLEAYYKPTAFLGADCVIGAAQTQGFDIETTDDGTLEVYVNNGSGWVKSGSTYPGSAKTLEKDKYYHVVASYDGKNVYVYVDGELVSTTPSTGSIIFPTESGNNAAGDKNYAMYIGGDYRPTKDDDGNYIAQSYAQNAFTGNIVFTKVYDTALNAREVSEKYAEIESRKSITALDDLNTMLTETIPAMTTDSNKQAIEAYAEEGWALMASEDVTEEEIKAYIAKASEIPSQYYALSYSDMQDGSFKAHGFAYDNSKVVWTPAYVTDVLMPGIRFTTRSNIGDAQMVKQNFTDDTVTPTKAFSGDAFVFETEFALLNKDNGYIGLNLLGKNESGEQTVAQLRFDGTNYQQSGAAYFADENGSVVGKKVAAKNSSDDRKDPASVYYVKIATDLVNQRYSAWLVVRKQDSGAYTETPASDEYLLVDNAPLNADGITEITGYSFNITGSTGTNGVWLRSVEISDAAAAEAQALSAEVTTSSADGVATATAKLYKALAADGEDTKLYAAVYDREGNLADVKATDISIAAGQSRASGSISADVADGQSVKFMLWDSSMAPLCESK